MHRLIDADKLIEYIRENGVLSSGHDDKEREDDVVDMVDEQPTVGEWIPVDKPPKPEEYVLLSFSNFSVPLVGTYRECDGGGAYYVGDDDESCSSQGIFVNGWMELPKCREDEE